MGISEFRELMKNFQALSGAGLFESVSDFGGRELWEGIEKARTYDYHIDYGPYGVRAVFKIDGEDGRVKNGEARFKEKYNGVYTFSFSVDYNYAVTGRSGTREAFRILATIVEITKEFLKVRDPRQLEFSSADAGRTRVYQTLARKFAKGKYETVIASPLRQEASFVANDGDVLDVAFGMVYYSERREDPVQARIYQDGKTYYKLIPRAELGSFVNLNDANFALSKIEAKMKEVTFTTIADLPEKNLVIIYKLSSMPGIEIMAPEPGTYDKDDEVNMVKMARQLQVSVNNAKLAFDKARASGDPKKIEKAMKRCGANIDIIRASTAKNAMKTIFKEGLTKPPVMVLMNVKAIMDKLAWIKSEASKCALADANAG